MDQREGRHRNARRWSRVLATCFRWQIVTGHERQPVKGTRISSSAATT